jgi:hypothetical protein
MRGDLVDSVHVVASEASAGWAGSPVPHLSEVLHVSRPSSARDIALISVYAADLAIDRLLLPPR